MGPNAVKRLSGGNFQYDPLDRLFRLTASNTRWRYGAHGELVGEYDASGNYLRRYVHGDADDEAIAWYEGSGYSDRRQLHADERGSIVAVSNASGAAQYKLSYDEHGVPAPGNANAGRFQYTGQTWLAEIGAYNYKARIYSPTLGRFLQTDPIGYADHMNMYAYGQGDPTNNTDPSGLGGCLPVYNGVPCTPVNPEEPPDIVVNGHRVIAPYAELPYAGPAVNRDPFGLQAGLLGEAISPAGGTRQINKPACKDYERQDRRWGDAVSSVGRTISAGGYLAAGISAVGGGLGIATADPALAYFGSVGFSDALVTISVGNSLQSLGAALNGAGGNGAPVTRDFVNERISSLLKGAPPLVKDLVKQGLDKAEEAAGLNMPSTCRM